MYLSGLITPRNWSMQQFNCCMNCKKDELKNLYHCITYLTQFSVSVQTLNAGIPYLVTIYKVL